MIGYLKEQVGANLLTSDYLLYPARKWCCLVTEIENIFCVSVINTVEVLENKKLLYGASISFLSPPKLS